MIVKAHNESYMSEALDDKSVLSHRIFRIMLSAGLEVKQ